MRCEESGKIVGFGISGKFTESSCREIDVSWGITDSELESVLGSAESARPIPGDYYIAVWAIQGSTGYNFRQLPCYRSRKIGQKSGYRWMAEMTIRMALDSGAKRIWVRTHTNQIRVTHMCSSLGFKKIGNPVSQHCGDQNAPRVIMVAETSWLSEVTQESIVSED